MVDGGIVAIEDVFVAMDEAKANNNKHMEIEGGRFKASYFRKERFPNDANFHKADK